jgi:hypothetical protein
LPETAGKVFAFTGILRTQNLDVVCTKVVGHGDLIERVEEWCPSSEWSNVEKALGIRKWPIAPFSMFSDFNARSMAELDVVCTLKSFQLVW